MENGKVGDVDELDNAPVPSPTDGTDMGCGMSDPNMGPDMNGEPNAPAEEPNMMGGDDPNAMGLEGMPEEPQQDNDELSNVVNNLSLEDQAAVLKYAKSMQKDDEGGNDDMMPEGRQVYYDKIINEVIADILHDTEKNGIERPETKLPKRYRKMNSPFNPPYEQ